MVPCLQQKTCASRATFIYTETDTMYCVLHKIYWATMYCVLARITYWIMAPYFQHLQCLWVTWAAVISVRYDFCSAQLAWLTAVTRLATGFTNWSNLDSREGWVSILDSALLRERRGSTWLCAGLCRHGRRCVWSDLGCTLLLHLQLSAHCQAIHKERDLAFRVKSAFQTPAPI